MHKVKVIDPKVVKRILNTPDQRSRQGKRDKAVLSVLARGLRRQEVCNLNNVDFDPHAGYIRVRTIKKGKDRSVKLPPEVVATLQAYRQTKNGHGKVLHDPEALFHSLGKHGPHEMRRLSPMAVNGIVAKALGKARVSDHITPHSLRHSLATTMLRQGRDLATIQHALGHRNISTTSQYLHAMNLDAAFTELPF